MFIRTFFSTFTILYFISTVALANSTKVLCVVSNQQGEVAGGADEIGDLYHYHPQKDGSKKLGLAGKLEQGTYRIFMCVYYNNDPTCIHEYIGTISDYGNLFSPRSLLLDKYNSTKGQDFGITARIDVAKSLIMVVEKDGSEQAIGSASGDNCDLNNPASYRRALASAYRSLILNAEKALEYSAKKYYPPVAPPYKGGGAAKYPRP